MFAAQLVRSVAILLLLPIRVACAAPPGSLDPTKANGLSCGASPELITDPSFTTINATGSQWRYSQHAGDRSFTVDAREGTITLKTIGSEPWAMFRQTITDERLDGANIRYTSDLRGDVSSEVTHFFGQRRSFFCRLVIIRTLLWEIRIPALVSGIGKATVLLRRYQSA